MPRALLFDGKRVIVDATFAEENKRRVFLEAANCLGVPAGLLLCCADPHVAKSRLDNRQGDASDADRSVYQQAAESWEPLGPRSQPVAHQISTDGSLEEVVAEGIEALCESGLFG